MLIKIALIIGISIATLLIAIVLDTVLAALPLFAQFLVQIPVLVLAIEAIQSFTKAHLLSRLNLEYSDVDTTFFFAAPLAALGSTSLFAELRQSFKL
jgi:hypothetical protein